MSVQECPFCYRRVSPREDDTCPCCKKDISKAPPENRERTLLTLQSVGTMPSVCFCCGETSTKMLAYVNPDEKISAPNLGEVAAEAVLHYIPLIGGLLSLLHLAGKRDKNPRISLKLPICDKCGFAKKQIQIEHHDFAERKLSVIVHKKFANAVRVANPKAPRH